MREGEVTGSIYDSTYLPSNTLPTLKLQRKVHKYFETHDKNDDANIIMVVDCNPPHNSHRVHVITANHHRRTLATFPSDSAASVPISWM